MASTTSNNKAFHSNHTNHSSNSNKSNGNNMSPQQDNRQAAVHGSAIGPDESSTSSSDENNNNNNSPKQLSRKDTGFTATGSDSDKLFQFLVGMKYDVRNRLLPYYKDDWGRPHNFFTVINASIYAFVIQLIPALIFAELIYRQTEGMLGIAETLLSSAIIGIMYAIGSGQPIVIMGITGPVAILLGTSYGLTNQFNANYFSFFFWAMIWSGLMHIVSAMIGLVSLVWKVTPFTSQIFELFIAITFLYSSLRDLISPLQLGNAKANDTDVAAAYAALLIGAITYIVAWTLHFAETWAFFTRQVRVFLTSYNTLIAIVLGTALSYIPGIDQAGDLPRVEISPVPWNWQPTYYPNRSWLVNPLEGIDARGIFAAIIPGFMFFLLFIIDHNVSSILTQSPKFNLKKPSAYHWDFFILGLTFIPCAMLALPPGNGLIPQAPLHARALCTREYKTDQYGVKREVVTHIEEQRWSGLAQALLMFVALACFRIISWIPNGCLFGLFLYLGMGALHGNEIWERITLCFMLPKHRPAIPVVRNVLWRTVQWYTLIQFLCAMAIFAVAQFAPVGYIYPALLTLLVPFRSFLLSRVFSEKDLEHLDPYGETEEEYHEEQREIFRAERKGSFDEEEVAHFPSRGEFRAQGLLKSRKHTIRGNSDDMAVDVIAPGENIISNVSGHRDMSMGVSTTDIETAVVSPKDRDLIPSSESLGVVSSEGHKSA